MHDLDVLLNITTVIPCYNVVQFCRNVIEETLLYSKHVVLVDDGSRDGTEIILKEIAAKYPEQVSLVTFPQNQGKGNALIAGFKRALQFSSFDALITIDSDGQHSVSDLPRFAKAINNGADLVIGTRSFFYMPFRSKVSNIIISWLLRMIYSHSPLDTQSGKRAFSPSFAKAVAENVVGGRYEMEFRCILLAIDQKRTIVSLPISTIYLNKNNSSHFSVFRDSWRIINVYFSHLFEYIRRRK